MLNIKDLSNPELPNQANYEDALRIALEAFNRKDPARLAANAGARFEDRAVIVPHLDREIMLDLNSMKFTIKGTTDEAPIWLSILTIHYINNASGVAPAGELTHFREFKEGQFYEPAFNQKTKDVLISFYGKDPSPMVAAGRKLGGIIRDLGDASVELAYFPYLPITCIVWRGDDEFPPEAGVLFDKTAELFFSAEDMAVAGQMAVVELIKAS